MVHKCANPSCNTEFRNSREGHLSPYEIRDTEESWRDAVMCNKKSGRAIVYFWLCTQCFGQFTLQFTANTGVTHIPKRQSERLARKYA
jgi:hypothetical protein